MKKSFLISFLLCIFSSLVLKAQQKPNVLILYTDDLGYGDLSCYGATAISTPHIDWLAKLRIVINSVCKPSRFLKPGRFLNRNL